MGCCPPNQTRGRHPRRCCERNHSESSYSDPTGIGLVSTETTAALRIDDPNGEPFAALAVVKNNRIAQGIVEGALTTGFGQTGKGQATVGETDAPEMLMGLALTPRESL